MRIASFTYTFANGEKVDSSFTGWKLRLDSFFTLHETAYFNIYADHSRELWLMAIGCWPLPMQLLWDIKKLTITNHQEPLSIVNWELVDRDYRLACSTFFLFEGERNEIQFSGTTTTKAGGDSEYCQWNFE